MRRPAAALRGAVLAGVAVLCAGAPARAQVEVIPHVGVDFEHFGQTYRITADQDTVAVINDVGTRVGLTVKTPWRAESGFRLETDAQIGRETRRFRLDFDGRWRRGADTFEVDQAGTVRLFQDGGDYSLSSNYVQEYFRVGWERRLGERVRLRFRETVDLTWYTAPDDYNLNTLLHRPGVDVRVRVGDLGDLRLGYQLGRRSVPDSTQLDYWRHTVDAGASLLLGWTTAFDVSFQLDRREYAPGSVRESSWNPRGDLTLEFSPDDRMTYRLRHESEFVRFDTPDGLDFDRDWFRTGVQAEYHATPRVDVSVMPVYSFLTSRTAPDEEYADTGLEFGVDWRIGRHTWISVTDEVGRRDYEIDGTATTTVSDLPLELLLTDSAAGSGFSDFTYNRITLLVTSDVTPAVSVNLFANWQPEDHRLNEHDTDSRILSGGVEYRF